MKMTTWGSVLATGVVASFLAFGESTSANPIVAFCKAYPAICAKIADAAKKEIESSGTYKCATIGNQCDPRNPVGGQNKCFEIARRLRKYSGNPSVYNERQVIEITQGKRTVCMAAKLIGCDNWRAWMRHRGESDKFRYQC